MTPSASKALLTALAIFCTVCISLPSVAGSASSRLREGALGSDQRMAGALRHHVHEGDRVVVLIDPVRRDLAAQDLGEDVARVVGSVIGSLPAIGESAIGSSGKPVDCRRLFADSPSLLPERQVFGKRLLVAGDLMRARGRGSRRPPGGSRDRRSSGPNRWSSAGSRAPACARPGRRPRPRCRPWAMRPFDRLVVAELEMQEGLVLDRRPSSGRRACRSR